MTDNQDFLDEAAKLHPNLTLYDRYVISIYGCPLEYGQATCSDFVKNESNENYQSGCLGCAKCVETEDNNNVWTCECSIDPTRFQSWRDLCKKYYWEKD